MKSFVVDANVAIKWVVPEIYEVEALRYLDHSFDRHAPELLLAEVASILSKKVKRGEIQSNDSDRIAEEFQRVDIQIHPMRDLFREALSIAQATGRSTYDCMYVALADRLRIPFVTADRKLYNGLQGSLYARWLVWVEEIP